MEYTFCGKHGCFEVCDLALVTVNDSFPAVLRHRLEGTIARFPARDHSIETKIAVGFGLLTATYAALYAMHLASPAFLAVYLLNGAAQVFLALNVAHDANHAAISRSRWRNRLLSHAFEICGISSVTWRLLHHRLHHACVNVQGHDDAIDGHGLLRFSSYAPWSPLHRFQHLYAPLVYALFSLHYVFVKDVTAFIAFVLPRLSRASRLRETSLFITSKAVYLAFAVALPIAVGRYPVPLVLVAFLLTHLLTGFSITFVFQASHVVDDARFGNVRQRTDAQVYHVLATTRDYATCYRVLTWLVGGLNHHVAHHLCPGVCHTRYPALTLIVKATAQEYGVRYRESHTIREALVRHFRLLRRLSQPNG